MRQLVWTTGVLVIGGAVAAAGCIGSSTKKCGNTVCSKGLRCHDVHGCITAEQQTACAGRPDGEPCQLGGDVGYHCDAEVCVLGACGDGVLDASALEQCDEGAQNSNVVADACRTNCTLPRCGDGVVDTGEVCDDGNAEIGDGCSLNCQSDETCGNGFVDSASETCDDGNLRSQDGCDSACRIEAASWEAARSLLEQGRQTPHMAYDSTRGVVVLFGGARGRSLDDTWEWDDAGWRRVRPATPPPAREVGAMAFDSQRGRSVLFGGSTNFLTRADTWAYDGADWALLSTVDSPPLRVNTAMAYDSARDRIVLFGGRGSATLGDTWEFDGTNWQQRNQSPAPSAREWPRLVFDSGRGVTVLFGGEQPGFGGTDDTWEYDGTSWVEVFPTTQPPRRAGHAMAYDPAVGLTFVHGGGTYDRSSLLADLWVYDGADWTELSPGLAPPALRDHEMTAAPGGGLLLHGGFDGFGTFAGTWKLTHDPGAPTTTWADRSRDNTPEPRTLTILSPDPAGKGEAILSAGASVRGVLDDTWRYEEGFWTPIARTGSPPVLAGRGVHDLARGRLVSFGGYTAATSAFDGTQWVDLAPASQPGPYRLYHMMAYDPARDRVVLYGGTFDATGHLFAAEHWEFDGTNWALVAAAAPPGPRDSGEMVYDAQRGVLVLYGGQVTNPTDLVFATGTWEHDGVAWSQVPTTSEPPPRLLFVMSYDPWRGVSVIHGGTGIEGGALVRLADTWEYDGADWRVVRTTASPPAQQEMASTFLRDRRRILMFGGFAFLTTAFEFGYRSELPTELCAGGIDEDGDGLVDCDDPDCNLAAGCESASEVDCHNGTDDDGDGLVDCADPNCGGSICDVATASRCFAGRCRAP